PFLFETPLDFSNIESDLRVNAAMGVPYTPDMIAMARTDVIIQGSYDDPGAFDFLERYPKAQVRNFSGQPGRAITEGDALIAYLQVLGTLVDFTTYDNQANIR
ncbi:MAG TPA: cbb3-type cytochrome c oxidase subunit II, partial [Saliniramus sp.]|nr:cbb3-type cytochrome c oxidase subunit II [Saliniramus sp.]